MQGQSLLCRSNPTPFLIEGTDGPKSSPEVKPVVKQEPAKKVYREDAPIRAAEARGVADPMDTSDIEPEGLKDISIDRLRAYRDMTHANFLNWEHSAFGTRKLNLGDNSPSARSIILKDAQGDTYYLGPKCPLTTGLYDDLYRMKRAHMIKSELRTIGTSPQFELYQLQVRRELSNRGLAQAIPDRLDEAVMIQKANVDKEIVWRNEYFSKEEYPSDRTKLPLLDRWNDGQLLSLKKDRGPEYLGRYADSSLGTDESVFRAPNWTLMTYEQQMAWTKEVLKDENGQPRMLGPEVPLTRAMYERIYNVLHSNAAKRPAIWNNPQFAVYQEEISKAIKARGLTVKFRSDEV